jgi:hypothetical protein
MPQQIKMQLTDKNAFKRISNNSRNNPSELLKYFKTTILNSPMIDIVHNSKPGCGSCGH